MRILQNQTIALCVDMQTRLVPAIYDHEILTRAAVRLIQGLRLLDVPVVAMRQYPKGLGELVADIDAALEGCPVYDKVTFSAMDNADIAAHVSASGKTQVIVFGIESHICVLQTVIDLAAAGYQPVLITDCVGSRDPQDKEIALRRAAQEGAILSTSESLLFELQRTSSTGTFKRLSALIKEPIS